MASKKTIWTAAIVVATIATGGAAVWWQRHAHVAETGPRLDVLRLTPTIGEGAVIADELGLFAKHGIRIDWKGKMAHGPAAIVALAGGELDAAGSVSTAMIIARTHGSNLKIVASSTLSTKELPLFRYLVKDGSPVDTNPSSFVGRRVVASPTTITWYPLVVWLKRHGVDPEKVEFITMPSPLTTEQSLRNGEVDVIGSSENTPPGTKLIVEGGVHFLPGLSDFGVLGIPQIGGWAMREDFIEKNPDVVRRFIRALREGYQWSNAHPDSAQAILNRRNELPPEYAKFLARWRPVSPDALVDSTSVRKWVAILEEFGQIKKGSVRPEDVYTNLYNDTFATK